MQGIWRGLVQRGLAWLFHGLSEAFSHCSGEELEGLGLSISIWTVFEAHRVKMTPAEEMGEVEAGVHLSWPGSETSSEQLSKSMMTM